MRWLGWIGVLVALVKPVTMVAQCRFAHSDAKTTVTYRFRTEVPLDPLVLAVRMEFRVGDDGTETIHLPMEYAGEASHSLANVRVESKGATLDPLDRDTAVVHTKPHSNVVLEYELHKDWTGQFKHPLQFHPVLMPEYLEVTGSNALMQIRKPESRFTTNFDWSGLPTGWVLATSFGATGPASAGSSAERCQTHTGPRVDVDEGLYAAGDFRLVRFQINGQPAVLAIRGKLTFTDQSAVSDVQKVVGNVRSFWHDNRFPYFLVTVAPYDQEHGSSDGSAYTNAFWMFLSRLDPLDGMLPQVAHESFHAWNPLRMGNYASGDEYEKTKWFKEGATEYYAQLLTYQAGEQTAETYVNSVNKDLGGFAASNSEYVRGRVIALWLDETIRKESDGKQSLDDVMFEMVKEANKPYTSDRILATAGRHLSPKSKVLLEAAALHHADLSITGGVAATGTMHAWGDGVGTRV
jgi:predicted metalloprotease with PDZ domain